ncbi:hypothetical protein BARBAKC583_0775 [Bartonella bacilliformis KC583]|uniref:Uncharacterized protein n=1 Tax=Bartonella bacilliformis (strain ATCC 35685 / KC583 / Herrer 020/F12,63) TaxID=360095 RepID=A1USW6_BARBK|nr:hypothetical protein BARBAKC583_0775 [Bartonella bacilliformis KC583]
MAFNLKVSDNEIEIGHEECYLDLFGKRVNFALHSTFRGQF